MMSNEEKDILRTVVSNQERLEEKVDSLIIEQSLIKHSITGGEFQGDGLLKRMNKVEGDTNIHKNIIWVIVTAVSVLSVIFGVIIKIKNIL